MKLTRCLIIAIGFLLMASAALAQTPTGSLAGTVTGAGAPLPGATVTATSSNLAGARTAITDAAGNYNFTELPPGDYAVTFELAGMQTLTRHVTVASTQAARLEVDLVARTGAMAEELTVTGTLIPRPTLEAMSPVATLDVEELTYRGATRLEDLLTSLPQIFASQNSIVANGASGTATVNLRNLGEVRTLVLLNGRRLTAGDPGSPGVDLNFIPSALVKRVDVLTGGASATYGADAVAGVVNFIMDTDFEGLKGGVQVAGYNHNNDNSVAQSIQKAKKFTYPSGSVWDGAMYDANVALGGKFGDGKGHGTAYFDYRNTTALLKARRDVFNCSVAVPGATGPNCSGSSTIPEGRFTVYDVNGKNIGDYTLDMSTGNTFKPRAGLLFNFAPYNYLQRPDKRFAGGGFLDYEWNKHAHGYLEVQFMNDQTDAQIAPSGDFYGNTLELNCDNPMLSQQQYETVCVKGGYGPTDIATVLIGRRSTESGGRVDHLSHNSWRQVVGVRGDITGGWSYDVNGVNAEVSAPESYENDFNTLRIQEALLVQGDRNDPSTWHCSSGNPACVPWNIFKKGGVTRAALNYVQLTLLSQGGTKTRLATGKVTGDLKQYGLVFPTAAEGLQLALGAQYGDFAMYFHPDQAYQDGIGAGQGGTSVPVDGSYNVSEAFAELLVPIAQGQPWAKDLSVELGYRSSDYSTAGRHPTYKAQMSWAPGDMLKLRAGFNRATRAPNVIELFQPQRLELSGSSDPCAGEQPSATLEQCKRTGVTAAQYGTIMENPAGQYNGLTGGNPSLKPEIGDTVSAGIVFTPGSAFTAAFDYYNIKVKDTIGALLVDDVIGACLETGDPTMCSRIHRDQFGSLWIVQGEAYTVATNDNVGKLRSEGVDVNLGYNKTFGRHLFTSSLMGTYLLKNETDTGMYSFDCVGYFGDTCNNFYGVVYGLTPKWRHLARFSWQLANTTLSLGWRMVGEVKNQAASSNVHLTDPSSKQMWQANRSWTIPTTHYLDLAGSYNLGRNVQLTLGVNNIFDKDPPLGSGIDNYDYGPGFWGVYDVYGRYVHSGIQFTF